MFSKLRFTFLFVLLLSGYAFAAKAPVGITITTKTGKWTAQEGELTIFLINVSDTNGILIKNASIMCEIGQEMMTPYFADSLLLNGKEIQTAEYALYNPGFLRCIVTLNYEGKKYRKYHTVGYAVDEIKPTVSEPIDFDFFWKEAKEELSGIPVEQKISFLKEKSTHLVNVYNVSIGNIGGSQIYGVLAVPKKPGKYPAVLQVPGAGVRPYGPDLDLANRGVIVFTIGIHGIPTDLDSVVYSNLSKGALNGYYYFNVQDRDKYYYKRVILGCLRSVDFLYTFDQVDKERLAVFGGSQGGALSIITASLDERIKYLVSFFPALCDMTGYLHGRAGGWPHVFSGENYRVYFSKESVNTLSYYDVVNFSKRLKTPGFYSWGFNDITCPPTSIYSAFNAINASKKLSLYYELGHWLSPGQRSEAVNWLLTKLK